MDLTALPESLASHLTRYADDESIALVAQQWGAIDKTDDKEVRIFLAGLLDSLLPPIDRNSLKRAYKRLGIDRKIDPMTPQVLQRLAKEFKIAPHLLALQLRTLERIKAERIAQTVRHGQTPPPPMTLSDLLPTPEEYQAPERVAA